MLDFYAKCVTLIVDKHRECIMKSRKKTRKRYESICRYALRYPNMTQESMARVFKINQATVSRALKEFDSGGNI